MAIGTPVSLGTVQNKTAQASTVLTTTAAVPAGALIVVAVAHNPDGALSSVSDAANGSYTQAGGASNGSAVATKLYFFQNAAALSSGASITVAWSTQPTAKAISAFYVEGISASGAQDKTGTGSGSSTTPSATSGVTTQADEITIGLVGVEGPSGDTFTQDSSPAYGNIPVRVGTSGAGAASNITLNGGYFIETATGTKTYNPTLGTSRPWAAFVATFKAAASTPTGTLAVTTANDTVSASGTTTVTGTVAKTAASDTLAASGTTTVVGTLVVTTANDTSAASGTTTVTGTLAVMTANDTLDANDSPSGTLAVTTANDTVSASGTTTVVGTLAQTAANDTVSAAGTTTVAGALAATVADDSLAASGSPVASGSLAVTAASDTLSASGSAGSVTGTLAVTTADDTLAASGTTTVVGSLAVTAADDTLSASGTTTIVGTLASTTGNDTLSASGDAGEPVAQAQSGGGRYRHYALPPEQPRKKKRDAERHVVEAAKAVAEEKREVGINAPYEAFLSDVELEIQSILLAMAANEAQQQLRDDEDAIALLLLAA